MSGREAGGVAPLPLPLPTLHTEYTNRSTSEPTERTSK